MSTDLLALISIVVLSITLVSTLAEYLKVKRKLHHIEEEEDALQTKARHKATRIIDHAQEAAFQIANQAVVTSDQTKHLVREKLEEVATKQLREYQKMVHSASGDIEHEVTKMIGLKMDEEFAKAQKEIDAYKHQKEQDLDKKVAEVVKKVSKQVIVKSIDSATQSQTVMQALEDAKKEYGL